MAKITSYKIKMLLCLLTGIISGVLIGSSFITSLVSYRLDSYHKEIKRLDSIIQDKDVRLKKFEESINKKKFLIRDIEIFLIYDDEDEIEKLTIEKNIKEKYNHLLGKEVKSIDAETVAGIIDNRIFKTNDREYKLSVNKLLISDVFKIWVEVRIEREGEGVLFFND